jgi:hypothetical protein
MLAQIREALGMLWRPDLILAVQRVSGPGWRLVFEALSLLGGAQITLVAVAWARWFWGRELALRLPLALFLGIGIDLLIWYLFPTPRPDDARIRVSSTIPIASFPSGHLVTVMTLWGTLALVAVLAKRVPVIAMLAIPAIAAPWIMLGAPAAFRQLTHVQDNHQPVAVPTTRALSVSIGVRRRGATHAAQTPERSGAERH